ncbi:hypothetical protein [Paenibacillus sp. Marseille-Q4541]|uniref:hypothetical protein n=1 Tax=Paenibacillus sp. Marseille-Q4541 TaxID=2831522 RepID=UPI001BA5843A|nr:hypothetical protein [Paenibacillus sp. Marseille-Q4541]
MTYITIDDKDEVQKILLDQIAYYKEELSKSYKGVKYYELVKHIVKIVNAAEDDESEENEDYDESIAISDIKWHLKHSGINLDSFK